MPPSSADAIAGKILRERLADQREALDNADRSILALGDDIADARGRRREAHAHIDCLTAQLRTLVDSKTGH